MGEEKIIIGRVVGGPFERPSRVGSEKPAASGVFEQVAILFSEGVYDINPISAL